MAARAPQRGDGEKDTRQSRVFWLQHLLCAVLHGVQQHDDDHQRQSLAP